MCVCVWQGGGGGEVVWLCCTMGQAFLTRMYDVAGAQARARAKSNRIVFVMASENWTDVLLNWVCTHVVKTQLCITLSFPKGIESLTQTNAFLLST